MLCAPSVVPPLTPWTRRVRVRNARSGATVSVLADGVEVGRDQVDTPDGFVSLDSGQTLAPGQRVSARQEFGGETSVPPPATSAVIVLKIPSLAALGKIFSRAPLYECSRCLWLEGIVPGAQVQVDDGAVQTVTAEWTGVHVDVGPVGTTLIRVRQGLGAVQGPWVTLPAALEQKDGAGGQQRVFAPGVELPLYACQRAIKLREVMPGATVTLTLDGPFGSGSQSSEFCLGATEGTFWVSDPLESGQRVELMQAYQDCLPTSETAVFPVSQWVPATPWFVYPVCAGDREVEIGGLQTGARVQFMVGTTALADAEAGEHPHRFIVPPLGNLTRLGIRQALCDAGPWSDIASTDLIPMGTPDRPRIVEPLHDCGLAVGVEGASDGTRVRVISQDWGGSIGEGWGNGDRTIDVDTYFGLTVGDILHLEVIQCGLFTALDQAAQVQPAVLDLPKPRLPEPLDDAGGTVFVFDVVPGAIVHLEWMQGDEAYAGTPISSDVVTRGVASIPVPPIPPGTRVRARQRLCSRTSRPSDVVRAGDSALVYRTSSSHRIGQITGWRGSAGRPPRVNSEDLGLVGTDLGIPVEHQGRLYFLFGDCDPRFDGDTNADADPIAWTTDSPEAPGGPLLNWLPGDGGLFHRLHVDGFAPLGNFEVPTGAFSYGGRLYVFVGRDTAAPPANEMFCPDARYRMHTSQLAVTKHPANDPQQTLEHLYQVAKTKGPFQGAGRWLVHVSPTVVRNADWPGLPGATGDGLVMFGTGCYQQSNVHLAWAPLGQAAGAPAVPEPSTWYYFMAGAAADGTDPANWRRADRLGGVTPTPLLFGELPQPSDRETLAELSVVHHAALRRWVMAYMHNGVTFVRTARVPWGPWSAEVAIFNGADPTMSADNLPGNTFVGQPHQIGDPRPTVTYAPYLVVRWFRFDRSNRRLTVYYTLSTEHPPYNTQLMRSVLRCQ
jgi:hypothetical protein